MKKIFAMAAIAAALVSCGNTRKLASIDELGGEWVITAIEGNKIVLEFNQDVPYIMFNTQDMLVAGNAGCNLITGTLVADVKAETTDFSGLGSTRMMCPDMEMEDKVLKGLAAVKKFRMLKTGEMDFLGEDGSVVFHLKRSNEIH